MSLISCPECNKEISDKAESCPHCGCPINTSSNEFVNNDMYTINGKSYDISMVRNELALGNKVNAIKMFREITNVGLKEAKDVIDSDLSENTKSTSYIIRCSKCGSTDFDMVKRNWSLLTGFMTNKVDRVCRQCKNKF